MKKILMMLLGVAFATCAWALDPVKYMKWDESKKELVEATCTSYTVVTKDTTTLGTGWYVVNSTVSRGAITVNGAAHLILCDGASLTVTGGANEAGINVASGKSLAIYGQKKGTGKLEANGGEGGAGIGSKSEGTCGTITINGGTIQSTGGTRGCGIGGGMRSTNGSTVIINAGTVTAKSVSHSAGIGGGDGYLFQGTRTGTDVITINGGTIHATCGAYGAGIGSGSDGFAAYVTINGGTITAQTNLAEAIGSGYFAKAETEVTFAEGDEFSIVAGLIEAMATATTVADYTDDHSAAYVKIESGSLPKVTLDEIIEGEDWTKFDVAYTLENLEEGVDYKVLIDVTAGGETKSITNATDIVIGSFTNSVDTVKLFGSKVFDGEAKVVLSLEADGEIVASSTEETVELLPPPVEYFDWDGAKFVTATNQAYEVVTEDTATFEDGKWYVVTNTIERAGIKVNGAAHLILCDGAKLKVTGNANKAGIEVPADKSLTIYGQSEGTGKLEASSAMLGAGIGGSSEGSCGAITINGGTIKATGGAGGAGIGGGMAGTSAATITFNGGEIEAIGGRSSAGIGSGAYNGFSVSRIDTDLITINGGTIKATGGQWGAGIGSGESGFAATVVINGGEITASTEYADAIGSGFNAKEVATVIFGTAMASKHVWAGASASNGVTMTTAAFATMHRTTYVELPVEIYTVAYDANGATGTMSNSVFAVSKEVTLKKNAFTAVGYDFAGWATGVAATNAVVYADEAKDTDFATTNATLTLYAKWNASTNSVTATSYEALTNTIATAEKQSASLPVTIGFTSGVTISGETVTLPSGSCGFNGLKYVGDDEGGSNLELKDGILHGSAMRGEVTVDALVLMQLANGGSIPSFQAVSEGETTVTNAVVMLLGDDGKAYFNDTDDVDQMITDILAADPRPTTVKLYEVKGAMVTFEAMGGTLTNGLETITYLCLPDTGYVLPDEVEREGYTLKGWFDGWTTSDNEITNNQEIVDYSEHSLYAQWTSTAPVQSEEGELHFADIVDDEPFKEIAANAYASNTELKTVTTPLYLEKIGSRAFMGCKAMKSLTLTATRDYETLDPTTLTIDSMAFAGCTSIEELVIGGKVKLGVGAFQNVATLKKIIFRGDDALEYNSDDYVFYLAGTKNGTGELKLYMSNDFAANNPNLVADFTKWNKGVKVIQKVDVKPVGGFGEIEAIDFSKLEANGRRAAVMVKTSTAGKPDVDDVDIEYSSDLSTWTKLTEGTVKTAYPDGTVMIEIVVPEGSSGYFKAVLNTQLDY